MNVRNPINARVKPVNAAPTFGYYRPCAQIAGMDLIDVPYRDDFSFPLEGIRNVLAQPTRICILCNPNNPTSTLVGAEMLLSLATDYPSTLFVIDEIYESYTGVSVLPHGAALPNLVALRSLSKSCGIAALRIGFACGTAPVIDRLSRVTGPYDVNQFAVVAANAVLDDWAYVEQYVAEVARGKTFILDALERMAIRHYSGGGNFLLVWPGSDVTQVERALRQRGVLVRSMHGKPLLDQSFRLSVGPVGHMQRFVETFSEVLATAR